MALKLEDLTNYKYTPNGQHNSLQVGNTSYNMDYAMKNPDQLNKILSEVEKTGNYRTFGLDDSGKLSSTLHNLNRSNTTPTPTTTAKSSYNPMSRDDYMKTYTDIINQAYNKSKNQVNEQMSQVPAMYQNQRNQTDNMAAQGARKLSELMANRGLTRSGTNVSNLAGIENNRTNAITDAYSQENAAQMQANNRLAEIEDSRAASLANAALGYEDYGFRAEQLNQQLAGLTGNYNGQDTLAAQQMAAQLQQQQLANQFAEAGLTGNYNGNPTLAAQQQQWQNQFAEQGLNTDVANMFMNYLLGYGQHTGDMPQIKGFDVGDYLTDYLSRLLRGGR